MTVDILVIDKVGLLYCAILINTLWQRQNGRHFPDDFSNAFSWMKMFKFRLRFHWSLFPRVHLTMLIKSNSVSCWMEYDVDVQHGLLLVSFMAEIINLIQKGTNHLQISTIHNRYFSHIWTVTYQSQSEYFNYGEFNYVYVYHMTMNRSITCLEMYWSINSLFNIVKGINYSIMKF